MASPTGTAAANYFTNLSQKSENRRKSINRIRAKYLTANPLRRLLLIHRAHEQLRMRGKPVVQRRDNLWC